MSLPGIGCFHSGGNQLQIGADHSGFFFFQAEDGIRDLTVTGVQTCALPILPAARRSKPGRATPAIKAVATIASNRWFTLAPFPPLAAAPSTWAHAKPQIKIRQIGRASCRERV